jgi:hypothetical protein
MGTLTVLPGGGGTATPPTEDTAVVRMLRRVLALAEYGQVHGVAIAWLADDGACSCYVAEDGGTALLGATTILQARMVQDIRS